jgi:hypothetical protein
MQDLVIQPVRVVSVRVGGRWVEVAARSFRWTGYAHRRRGPFMYPPDGFGSRSYPTGATWTGTDGFTYSCPASAILAIKEDTTTPLSAPDVGGHGARRNRPPRRRT